MTVGGKMMWALARTLHGSAPALSSLLMKARRGTLYLRICLSTVML